MSTEDTKTGMNRRDVVIGAAAVTAATAAPISALAEGKPTVLLTGSTRGIGFALASAYAVKGWKVIATCRKPKEAEDLQSSLEDWIGNYVSEAAKGDDRARFPLREAKIEVKPVEGKSGAYNAVAYLRPWLQMEELTTSLRMVARIPGKA